MADNTINIDLVINAAKSAKTLAEQREALKGLRQGLEEVKYGSGAFELLTESAESLKKEMGLLNLTFEDAYGDTLPLTSQIGELEDRLYQLALAGQQNTEEFQLVTAETVRLKKSLRDVDDTVDALSQRGAKLQGFIQVAEGIAGGFAAAQGALALFGNENEEVEKAILKVQGAMSLLQGIQALSTALTQKNALFTAANTVATSANTSATLANATAQGVSAAASAADATAKTADATATAGLTLAQRALNAVMAISPMGLITLAVTGAVAAYSLLTGKTKEQIAAEKEAAATKKRLAEEQKRYTEYIAKESVDYRTLVEQLRQTNPKSEERLTLIKQINATYGTTIKNLKDEDAFNNQLNVSIEKYIENLKLKYALQANGTLIEQNLKKQAELNTQTQVLLNGELKSSYDTIVASMVQMGTPLVEAKAKAKDYLMTTNKDLVNINNQLKAADTRLAAYVNFGVESGKKITDVSNKATETVIKNSDKATKNDIDNLLLRAKSLEEYNRTIEELEKKVSDLEFKNRSDAKEASVAYYADLKRQYEIDSAGYTKKLREDIDAQKKNLKDGLITKREYETEVQNLTILTGKIQEQTYLQYLDNVSRVDLKNREETLQAENRVSKAKYELQLENLANEEKLQKDRLKTKFAADARETANQKKSLETQLVELEKANAAKTIAIEKNEKYLETLRKEFSETADIDTRQQIAAEMKIWSTRISQGKLESDANKQLILEKKEQLKINTELYGGGAKTSAKEYTDSLLTIEEQTTKKRALILTEYYLEQKQSLDNAKEQDKVIYSERIGYLEAELKAKQENHKKLEVEAEKLIFIYEDLYAQEAAATDEALRTRLAAEKAVAREKKDSAWRALNDNEDLIGILGSALTKADAEQRELDQKYEKDLIDLKAGTLTKIDGLNLEELANLKLKHEKELQQMYLQRDKYVDYEKSKNELVAKQAGEYDAAVNARIKGYKKETDAIKDVTTEATSWFDALSQAQQANFNKSVDLFLQLTQMTADYITQTTDRNIANIERIKEAELEAFDENQELREMERNDATAADYQEVIRKRSVADQRLAIEDEFNNKIKAEKQRAFEAQKAASIIEIGINTAVEISKTLANPLLAVLVGLAGAAQAAFVAQQSTPEFALGGILEGPSHSEGGIPTKFGELEGGEAIINKKSTKKFKPLLSAINAAGGGVKFADGGVLGTTQTTMIDNTSDLTEIKGLLKDFASRPILTYVNESDVTKAQRNQKRIEKRTTF